MNERIEELSLQCIRYKLISEGARSDFDYKKFAELIVRECIGCCEQVISDPVPESVDTWLNGGSQCIQEIKQHFGIKE